MTSNKLPRNSQADVVATKTVNWNIVGWEGPFKHLVRSQADCHVSVGESPTETIDLRFYLRYVEDQNDPRYDLASPTCGSKAKFSGYSLMVDVLSEHKEKLMISITAKKPDNCRSNFAIKRGSFVVDPSRQQSGITAIDVFARCELWKEDANGVNDYKMIGKNPFAQNIPTSDKKFVLTVTSYKMEYTAPENPKQYRCHTEEVSELAKNLQTFHLDPENHSDLVLHSEDGMIIRAHRFILAARSPYFCSLLKDGATSLSLDVLGKPLMFLLHWIYTEEIQNSCDRYVESIVEAAVKFEIPCLLKALDNELIKMANTENMFRLAELAKSYGMEKAADDLVNFMKCNLSTWLKNPRPPINVKTAEKIGMFQTYSGNTDINTVDPLLSHGQRGLEDSSSSLKSADDSSLPAQHQTAVETINAGACFCGRNWSEASKDAYKKALNELDVSLGKLEAGVATLNEYSKRRSEYRYNNNEM